jgi:hypothetical protein
MKVAVVAHGDRSKVESFKVKIEAGALQVCVPARNREMV